MGVWGQCHLRGQGATPLARVRGQRPSGVKGNTPNGVKWLKGQRPLRGSGVVPPVGSRGSAPHGVPGQRLGHAAYRDTG